MGKIKVTECGGIKGLKVVEPTVFGDARGYFIPHLSNLNIIPAYSTCRRHSDQLFIPLSEYFCYPDTPPESLL